MYIYVSLYICEKVHISTHCLRLTDGLQFVPVNYIYVHIYNIYLYLNSSFKQARHKGFPEQIFVLLWVCESRAVAVW